MKRIGVLTSGGDAPGMNAAVRAVVRMGLDQGATIYGIYEGYTGLIEGGDAIRPLSWNDVGGILHRGGTVIGSSRCPAFREREGRLKATLNLINQGIDALIVIGGNGSLTAANILAEEWPGLVAELVERGAFSRRMGDRFSYLAVAGLPASIDNDLACTDITVGADSALNRITATIDAIASTAASHQRSFVVEVMGRKCGYLALMGALASAADWVLIPESPPNLDDWEAKMCSVLKAGRDVGRRDSIVVVAEGAQDRRGNPISSSYVKQVLEERLGEDTRVTILGHVQRGGSPSAFDRNLSTLLGADAISAVLAAEPGTSAQFIGMLNNRVTRSRLSDCLAHTAAIAAAIARQDFERALALRGSTFAETFQTVRTLVRALPHPPNPDKPSFRIGVLSAGAPSPGMNTAVRAAVRLGIDDGHTMLGIYNGFQGLIDGDIEVFDWMKVNGWAHVGGSFLGPNRKIPAGSDFYAIARNIDEYQIDALLMVGGTAGYKAAQAIHQAREYYPSFNIPVVCLPATIDNDLPGAELSIGADTATNVIVEALDKIKQSAVASERVFVVEVMGRYCGYLALTSAMATGAERVYLHEEGVTLTDLEEDVQQLIKGFRRGKRLGVIVRNEMANATYSTDFMCALFEEEGGELFDVRKAILGHIQQGGNPTPFDRVQATRLARHSIHYLEEQLLSGESRSACIGLAEGKLQFTLLEDADRLMDSRFNRPKRQWWMDLRPVARVLAQPANGGMGIGE